MLYRKSWIFQFRGCLSQSERYRCSPSYATQIRTWGWFGAGWGKLMKHPPKRKLETIFLVLAARRGLMSLAILAWGAHSPCSVRHGYRNIWFHSLYGSTYPLRYVDRRHQSPVVPFLGKSQSYRSGSVRWIHRDYLVMPRIDGLDVHTARRSEVWTPHTAHRTKNHVQNAMGNREES